MNDGAQYARKSLGQHWLDDAVSLESMCAAADVREGDTVLEIGPGTGELTRVLLQKGASVVAVELDERLAHQLQQDFANAAFTLHTESILTFDLTQLPKTYKIVANIPYYLTSKLLRILSESTNPPQQAALLVQKEVAERVAADPGSLSLLSVATQFYWEVSLSAVVPAHLFRPPPKVDSQILTLKRRQAPLFKVDEAKFFRIVKAGFSARRKKLSSSLAAGLRRDKSHIKRLLGQASINPDRRAQMLSLEEWYSIYQVIDSTE